MFKSNVIEHESNFHQLSPNTEFVVFTERLLVEKPNGTVAELEIKPRTSYSAVNVAPLDQLGNTNHQNKFLLNLL